MTIRRIGATVIWATVLAVILGESTGEDLRLSIDLWLAVAAVGAALVVIIDVIADARISIRRPRNRLSRSPETRPPDIRPRNLRSLERILVGGTTRSRDHTQRLRPRLRSIAAHSLRVDHGIDLESHPGQAKQVLGPVYWLLDEEADERVPTLGDVEDLLGRLRPPSADRRATAPTGPVETLRRKQ